MKFEEAEKRIIETAKGAALVNVRFERDTYKDGKTEIECLAIIVFGGQNSAHSFKAPTWEGVLKKLDIFMVPETPPAGDEAPEMDLCIGDGQAPQVAICDGCERPTDECGHGEKGEAKQ